MKKKMAFVFCLVFSFSFLLMLAPLLSGSGPAAPKVQGLLLICIAAFCLSTAVVLSFYRDKNSAESVEFGKEIFGAALAVKSALPFLFHGAFRLFWLAFLPIVLGSALLANGFSLCWGLMVAGGQIVWLLSRGKIFLAADIDKSFPAGAKDALVWIMRGMDLVALLATYWMVSAASSYAEIVDSTELLVVGFLVSFVLVVVLRRARKMESGPFALVQALLAMVWVVTVAMILNYELDYFSPSSVAIITYRDCPSLFDLLENKAGEKISTLQAQERRSACKILNAKPHVLFGDKAEITVHRGALGIAWRSSRLLP